MIVTTRPPDVQSADGRVRAWLIPVPDPDKLAKPDHAGYVRGYLVHFPGAHAFWDEWTVEVIHLRDLPGVKPAHKRTEACSHEFLFTAFEKEQPHDPDAFKGTRLVPLDLVHQVEGITDEQARTILDLAVRLMCDCGIPPDADYRGFWTVTLTATAQCTAAGNHPAA